MRYLKSLCVVCHDAGGAEVISSYINQSSLNCVYVLEGPACSIFKRKLGELSIVTLEEGLSKCSSLLCGTSWQSNLEWKAVKLAKQLGKYSIAFLDHWVNFPERFLRNGISYLPDELWVGDEYARDIAKLYFPDLPLKVIPNPYFIQIKNEFDDLEKSRPREKGALSRVLFVAENISDHALAQYGDRNYWGYTEIEAIEHFFHKICFLNTSIEKVVIRPHPSESPEKYEPLVKKHAPLAQLSMGRSLLEDVYEADIVVGCYSMAMVIAQLVKRKVYSCVPRYNKSLDLPHNFQKFPTYD